jgi:hypothetical protein
MIMTTPRSRSIDPMRVDLVIVRENEAGAVITDIKAGMDPVSK